MRKDRLIPRPNGFTGITGLGKTDNVRDIIEAIEKDEKRQNEKRQSDDAARKQIRQSLEIDNNIFGGKEINELIDEHGLEVVQELLGNHKSYNCRVAAARINVARREYREEHRNELHGTGFMELDHETERSKGEEGSLLRILRGLPTETKKTITEELPFNDED